MLTIIISTAVFGLKLNICTGISNKLLYVQYPAFHAWLKSPFIL